ncbi:MAG: ThiF family adenylyltransferase [Burkholderiaceae bacterium]
MDLQSQRRFSGLTRLFGTAGAQHIRTSHVAVVGIGGVGSWAAEALARSGVACLTLIDMDHVAESNINRQVHAVESTLGQAKVVAMRDRIASIHPECVVNQIDEFVTPANWPCILPAGVDAVIDACDQLQAKTAMAAWALNNPLLFVCVGAAGGKQLAHKVDIDDLSNTTHDPLLAQLRYRLRKHHGALRAKKMGLTCVYSKEAVQRPQVAAPDVAGECPVADNSLNCSGYGSVVSVTATFGHCAAGWVLSELALPRRG